MATETCAHHWIIERADGPASPGICQLCGETKEFKNHLETEDWKGQGVKGRAALKAQKEVAKARREYTVTHIGLPFSEEN